jgi:hypothetical protein
MQRRGSYRLFKNINPSKPHPEPVNPLPLRCCHTCSARNAAAFLPQLLEVLIKQDPAAVHDEFRLWITAEPTPLFPIGLLQMSIKLTNEPPQGMRAGILRSYSWMSQDLFDNFRRPEWRPMLYTMCHLHSVVQVCPRGIVEGCLGC